MKKKEQVVDGWHFIANTKLLAHTNPPLAVEPGYIYSEDGPIVICHSGLHASRTVRDALGYAPGTILCRVNSYGDIFEQSDKLVSRHREVVGIREVSKDLALWACWCVRQTPVGDGRLVWDLLTDKRSRDAIVLAERYCRGESTRDEAYAAANAAYAAANDAAAAYAAYAAAVAYDANAAVAAVAANAAAYDANAAAAYDANRKFQSEELERRMLAIFDEAI